jgi:hypothetical protein
LCIEFRAHKIVGVALDLYFLVARHADLWLIESFLNGATIQQHEELLYRSRNCMLPAPWAQLIVNSYGRFALTEKVVLAIETLVDDQHFEIAKGKSSIGHLIDYMLELMPDKSTYYFDGKPAFLGNVAIQMQLRMQRARSIDPPGILGDISGPILLSAASGLECPVSYGTIMTLDKVKAVLDYVKEVSAMGKAMGGWKRGSKYFYGHEIV